LSGYYSQAVAELLKALVKHGDSQGGVPLLQQFRIRAVAQRDRIGGVDHGIKVAADQQEVWILRVPWKQTKLAR
jgi:hypothetical protein